MRMKTIASALALTLAAGSTQAILLYPAEPAEIKFKNYEQVLDQIADSDGLYSPPADGAGLANGNQDLRGLIEVTSIIQDSGTWNQGDDDKYIWGVFYGFDIDRVTTVTSPAGITQYLDYVGGYLDLYVLDSDIDPFSAGITGWTGTDYAASTTYLGINDLNGDGVVDVDPWVSIVFEPTTSTTYFDSTLQVVLSSTSPVSGSGTAFMSVGETPNGLGTANSTFDTDSKPDLLGNVHDFYMKNDFHAPTDYDSDGKDDASGVACEAGTSGAGCLRFAGGWNLLSSDPVYTTVPEPGILALLGAGLFGLLGMRGRREA